MTLVLTNLSHCHPVESLGSIVVDTRSRDLAESVERRNDTETKSVYFNMLPPDAE